MPLRTSSQVPPVEVTEPKTETTAVQPKASPAVPKVVAEPKEKPSAAKAGQKTHSSEFFMKVIQCATLCD